MKQFLIISLITFLFTGCSVKHNNIDLNNVNKLNANMQSLSLLIQSLSGKVTKKESNDLAYKAINYSKQLANDYEVVAPALFHNSLINMGIKEKGYCYHYANDLIRYLKNENYKSFNLVKVVSNRKEYFEHSAIIVTRDDVELNQSVVLDAWRNSGILYYSVVKDDKKYKWEIK